MTFPVQKLEDIIREQDSKNKVGLYLDLVNGGIRWNPHMFGGVHRHA